MCDSGLSWCVYITSFERWLTPLFADSLRIWIILISVERNWSLISNIVEIEKLVAYACWWFWPPQISVSCHAAMLLRSRLSLRTFMGILCPTFMSHFYVALSAPWWFHAIAIYDDSEENRERSSTFEVRIETRAKKLYLCFLMVVHDRRMLQLRVSSQTVSVKQDCHSPLSVCTVCVCVCVCVCVSVRVCAHACVRACMYVCIFCIIMLEHLSIYIYILIF